MASDNVWWPRGLSEASSEAELQGAYLHLAMDPSVEQTEPNNAIPLYSGPIEVIEGSRVTTDTGTLRYEFVPKPRITVEFNEPQVSYGTGDEELHIRPLGSDSAARIFVTESHFGWARGGDSKSRIAGIINDPISFDITERLGRVHFHLFNFFDFFGETLFSRDGHRMWPGRVSFGLGPWRVTLDSLFGARKRWNQASRVDGHILTHVGKLERQSPDGHLPKLFGAKEASRALEALNHVFSFANGSRCPCVLPFGYRHMPREVSRCYQPVKLARAASTMTWFPKDKPEDGFAFATRLYDLLQSEENRDWLTMAISLYLESNRNTSAVDIELAKSQIALELLAWEAVQEQQRVLSEDSFGRLHAADKMRIALLWAGIPTDIPGDMIELHNAIPLLRDNDRSPEDGPFVITQLRNATIHADRAKLKKLRNLDDLARYQAWQLSQSYVALLILRLLNYRGPYFPHYRRFPVKANTSTVGKPKIHLPQIVPWV